MEKALNESVFSAAVIGIVKSDGTRHIYPVGSYLSDGKLIKVHADSIFDIASITKSIPTSSLALKLIDEGRLNPNEQLIKYIPEFNNNEREKVLIKHLLTQTLDYDFRLSAFKDSSPDEIFKVILQTDFKTSPGTKYYYSNATSILLGIVIERIFGDTLDKLGEKYFFKPLKMERTTYHPLLKFSKDEIVPTEIQDWRQGLIHGEVHDESAYALQKKQVVGSAGIFSTAPDLLNFFEMLLHGGELNGNIYYSQKIIEHIQENQLSDLNISAALGWELNQPHYMGNNCLENTFGKTGFTGCSVVANISQGVALVILSNFTHPTRKADASLINSFRRDIADIVFNKSSDK